LKNIQKKFKLREKLIANLNQDYEQSNCNSGNNKKNFKGNDESNYNHKTYTRLLDPNLLETEISHNKTILIGNHIEMKLLNENNKASETINLSMNNELSLNLDSNSILKNSFYKQNSLHNNNNNDNTLNNLFRSITNTSTTLGRNYDRAMTPINLIEDKSGFLNYHNTSCNFIDNNNILNPPFNQNLTDDKNRLIIDSSKHVNFNNINTQNNIDKLIKENDAINNKFIFTSGNNIDNLKLNSNDFNKINTILKDKIDNNLKDTIDNNLKDMIDNNLKDLKGIDYNELLFGQYNKLSESIFLNEENQDDENVKRSIKINKDSEKKNNENNENSENSKYSENLSITKYEENDSFNSDLKKSENSTLMNLDKIEETKSLGDINLLTTNENVFKIQGNILLEAKKDLSEKNLIKINYRDYKENIEFKDLNYYENNKLNTNINKNTKTLFTLDNELDDFSKCPPKIKEELGNQKMNFSKKFNFDLQNQKKALDNIQLNSDRIPFNTLITKINTKYTINILEDDKNLLTQKSNNIEIKNEINLPNYKNKNFNKNENKYTSSYKKMNDNNNNIINDLENNENLSFDIKNIIHKHNITKKIDNQSLNKKHKKSKSNPNFKECIITKKLNFGNCKSINEIKFKKQNNSKDKNNNFNSSNKNPIYSGIIPLNEIKRKNDIKKSKNIIHDKNNNGNISDKKLIISYVDFNKNNNSIQKLDLIKQNNEIIVNNNNNNEKKNFEIINEIFSCNNNNKNITIAKQPIMRTLNYIDENTFTKPIEKNLIENIGLKSDEYKIKKVENKDLITTKKNFSNFMNKVNNVFSSQASGKKNSSINKSKSENWPVLKNKVNENSLKRFISDDNKFENKIRYKNYKYSISREIDNNSNINLLNINNSIERINDYNTNRNLDKENHADNYTSLKTEYQIDRSKN